MISHLRGRPLFNRAVIMSGILGPLMIPTQRKEANKALNEIWEILGIEE
jgi:carboxylesterase type B